MGMNAKGVTCITGMLLFGTATVTIQKFIFSMTAVNRDGVVAEFKKPWFQTEAMFCGMFLCLLVYEITRCFKKCKKSANKDAEAQLIDDDGSIQHLMQYVYVAAPAMCDLCATCLMNIGLFYIDASIWQMLRGSMVIFSTLLSMIFLKRKYYGYHWIGITLVTVGLVTVAFASLFKPPRKQKTPTPGPMTATPTPSAAAEGLLEIILGNSHDVQTWQVVMSICLVVGAQIIQASQIVIEEFLLKNVKAAASLIVGIEGLWGGLVGSLVMWAVHNTPSGDGLVGQMFHEDTIDSFIMMKNNPALINIVIWYILCILFYNLFGMMVTQNYSAVYRTILEAIRTLCIWIVNIIIYYTWAERTENYEFGEPIDRASGLQLAGFLILLTGNFIFNKVIRFKGLYYEDKKDQQ